MTKAYSDRLDDAVGIPDVFEVVKLVVEETLGARRAGLMLGMSELGADGAFVGAYYPIESNIIVVNKSPIERIRRAKPKLLKPYYFHVLLHEYLHSLGVYDEWQTRSLALEVSERAFGGNHMVTRIAKDFNAFFTGLMFATKDYNPPADAAIELVKGFDKAHLSYFS
jgi:hypothetical protein